MHGPSRNTREDIVAELVRRGAQASPDLHRNGLRLTDIANILNLSHPTVIAHLRKLEADGAVKAVDEDGNRLYCAEPKTTIAWTSPRRRIHLTWSTWVPIDWRFPLVSRVPDAPAQRFLIEWLDRAQARGLLPAQRSRFEPSKHPPQLVRIAVYGSCARGDAGPKADIDVLVLSDRVPEPRDPLIDLAHEVALDHPRAVDVQMLAEDGMGLLPPGFRESLRREAKTVWSNDSSAPLVEEPLEAVDGV